MLLLANDQESAKQKPEIQQSQSKNMSQIKGFSQVKVELIKDVEKKA